MKPPGHPAVQKICHTGNKDHSRRPVNVFPGTGGKIHPAEYWYHENAKIAHQIGNRKNFFSADLCHMLHPVFFIGFRQPRLPFFPLSSL